ncbi:MAG: acyltransferase [Lachnospiraceae bacterium]|nr:acyltransferase [Lachnospiraceae bacterium]
MMKNKRKSSYMALVVAVLAALVLIFYKNLSYEYALAGETVAVFDTCYANAVGYALADAADGNGTYFEVTGDDPQFYLDLSHKQDLAQIGGIELVMTKVAEANHEMPIQVFYKKEKEDGFSERHSVKTVLMPWVDRVLIPLPQGTYEQLRFDVDASFELYEINVCTEKMIAKPYVSSVTTNRCLLYFPVVLIGFPLVFWAHSVRNSSCKSIFFGTEPSPKREIHWDYMRIFAAVLVILAHACSPMVTQLEETGGADWKRLLLVCGLSFGLTCNLLYVMLSGALLLNSSKTSSQTENVAAFYLRRASKIIIPLAAYYLFLLSINNEVSFLPPKNLGTAFKRMMTGAPDVAPHFWLIYTIISLYLVTPFFRVMVAHLSDKMIASLATVILVLNALTYYLPLFGMQFGATTFLAGWEGVFLLGYILTRQSSLPNADKRTNWFVLAGVVAFVVTVAVVFTDSTKMNYVYNNTPTMVLMSCAIFALFLKYKEKFATKTKSHFGAFADLVVRMCSKYSYSIILIHWYALFAVVQGKLHITALRFGCFGGIAATVAITFVVCLVMAIVFDNTVVIVCTVIFDKISEKIMNSIEKHRVK